MKITKCEELIFSDIIIETDIDGELLSISYNRLEDKEGNINWDYSSLSELIEPEEMKKLEKEYQKYKKI